MLTTIDEVKSRGWFFIQSGSIIMLNAIGTAILAIVTTQDKKLEHSIGAQFAASTSGISGALSVGLILHGTRMIYNPNIYVTPPPALEEVVVIPAVEVATSRLAS